MSKVIKHQDIDVGDRIRVTREFTVTAVRTAGPHNGAPRTLVFAKDEESDIGGEYLGKNARVELLDRPLNLPTKPGSIVKVNSASGEGMWFLTQEDPYSPRQWVSRAGTMYTQGQFEAFLRERSDRTFEVIL